MALQKRFQILNVYFLTFIIVLQHVRSSKIFTDQFVVEVSGGMEEAKQVAKDHGFDFLGKVSLCSIFVFLKISIRVSTILISLFKVAIKL